MPKMANVCNEIKKKIIIIIMKYKIIGWKKIMKNNNQYYES
jgi:hypothetical protein